MSHKNLFSENSVFKDLPGPVSHCAANYGFDIKGDGSGVKIAIIDTGRPDHLSIREAEDSVNFAGSYTVLDTLGQATIIGGIINGNNPNKILGIAPEAELYYAKICDDNYKVSLNAFISGFLYAVIKNVDIIVIATTTDISNDIFKDVIEKAIKSNTCVICSAGSRGCTQYPAAYKNALSVGVLKQDGSESNLSDVGKVNVVGTSICSTYINQGFCVAGGSPISTAIVGGLAALVVEKTKSKQKTEPVEIYARLEQLTKRSG